jgi:kumamolisin
MESAISFRFRAGRTGLARRRPPIRIGVPDVARDADPTAGYVTLVDWEPRRDGGTSAVAPLWAGLIALINESIGKPVGFLNPLLYSDAGDGAGS